MSPRKANPSRLFLHLGYKGLKQDILSKYMNLDQQGSCQVLYVWIDGSGQTMRCKTRTLTNEATSPSDVPVWNFDGSSTGQAEGSNSDVYLYPVALFPDPFRGLPNKIALCETMRFDHKPLLTSEKLVLKSWARRKSR